ncbi:hypothetical protein F5Y09DRAFT_342641 [Xylaria sp. FL1042]|nr:hypothetical protein F5Y09DRAFT_342641 [Xylaria sp. FL1042]
MSASDYYNTERSGGGCYTPQQGQSPYPQQPTYHQQQQQQQHHLKYVDSNGGVDGERGLGSTLVGAGTGSYVGHKLGKGTVGTLLGGAVGAVAANTISHKIKGHHGKEHHGHHHGHHGPHGSLYGHAIADLLPVKEASSLDILPVPAVLAAQVAITAITVITVITATIATIATIATTATTATTALPVLDISAVLAVPMDTMGPSKSMDYLSKDISANAPEDGSTNFNRVHSDDNSHPPRANGTSGQINRSTTTGGSAARGRGAGSVRGRGQAASRERGGTPRTVKRLRIQYEDNLDDDDGGEINDTENKKGNNSQKRAPISEPESPPAEVSRRKTSLRDRLIKGEYEPQAIGMRAYNMKKAAAANATRTLPTPVDARKPLSREFLVPIGPRQEVAVTSSQHVNSIMSSNNAVDVRPNTRIAHKSTPIHQLHFPEALLLSIKQKMMKWEAKEHAPSSVFVVARIVESDIVDMHVFTTLREATADALHVMAHEHPEAFASGPNEDDDGNEIKPGKSEPTSAVIQQILTRPDFQQVPMTTDQSNARTSDVEEDSMFVIKTENPEPPPPSRIADPRPDSNSRGELLLRDAPEPIYVFCGEYKIPSFGLKMEARRTDGAAVKVSVHLKNLRKPAHN